MSEEMRQKMDAYAKRKEGARQDRESAVERVKYGVRTRMIELYPKARFASFEPPMVEERLRIGVEYQGCRHYVALSDALIGYPDDAIRMACLQLQGLIERKEK